jgi:hypothetical protein
MKKIILSLAIVTGFTCFLPANAYYPAIRTLNQQVNGSGYVECTVLDPQNGSTYHYTGPTNQSVIQLTAQNGIVAYSSGTGFNRYIHAVTYDPYVKSFRAFSYGILDATVPQLIVRDGVVGGYFTSGSFSGSYFAITYDPSYSGGSWRFFQYSITTSSVTAFACNEGVTAIAFDNGFQSNGLNAVVYDAQQQDWRTVNRSIYPVTSLSIASATITYMNSSGTTFIGYSTGNGWVTGQQSSLVCKFTAAPANGFDKHWIWITDQSFAANSWYADFGDGAGAPLRSGSHTYASVAVFGITMNLGGLNGGNSSCTDSVETGNIGVEEFFFKNASITGGNGLLQVSGLFQGTRYQLRIFDLKGSLQKQLDFSGDLRESIDLAKGCYLLQLEAKEGYRLTRRLPIMD